MSIHASSPSETMIVMDMSGSMYGDIGDRLKIDIAREKVDELISTLDDGTVLGLEMMGGTKKRGCKNFSLVVSPQLNSNKKILSIIKRMKPKGKTPISSALRQAANTLSYTGTSNIVIVSDGRDNKCGNNSCKIAKNLKSKYPKLHIDIISLATDKKAERNLQCIARVTGGRYIKSDIEQTSSKKVKTRARQKENLKKVQIQKTITPQLKIYAALPLDDVNAITKHEVYTLDGSLLLECISTQKDDCIKKIEAGKYIVSSIYKGKTHETKLLVLANTDAYLYTSFRSQSQSNESSPSYADINAQDEIDARKEAREEAKEEAKLAKLEAQEERAAEKEAKKAEAHEKSESKRSFIDKMKDKRKIRSRIPKMEDEQMLLQREREMMMSDPSMTNPEDMDMLEMQNERNNRRRPPL